MGQATGEEMPFSERYSLPAQVSESLGEVSWETVAQLSCDFQLKTGEKKGRVRKILKELQMSRLVLMDKIKHCSKGGKIEPKLLVETTRLLQKCERVAEQYELDLEDFSTFLYMISEKLKKEKIAKYHGHRAIKKLSPIGEELSMLKDRSEPGAKMRGGKAFKFSKRKKG